MKKFGLIISFLLVLLVVSVIGLAWFRQSTSTPSPAPSTPAFTGPQVNQVVVKGSIVCLPHKVTNGPQTLECAFGLQDTEGRYFALRDTDPNYVNVSGAPMNELVEVEGTFMPKTDSNYQDIGTIEVTRITQLP